MLARQCKEHCPALPTLSRIAKHTASQASYCSLDLASFLPPSFSPSQEKHNNNTILKMSCSPLSLRTCSGSSLALAKARGQWR
jgi:hypothetical protein